MLLNYATKQPHPTEAGVENIDLALYILKTMGSPVFADFLRLIAIERWGAPQPRRPEPQSVMTDPAAVSAFHTEGEVVLSPIYLFNARVVARLAPPRGRVLDLGSGSGQFLLTLATLRPDLAILGVEPSSAMRARGQAEIDARGFSTHVRLLDGDMTDRVDRFLGPFDVVSSLFALHHLSASSDLSRCFTEIRRLRDRDQSAVWLFDHARPRGEGVPERFARLFARNRSPLFQRDSANSVAAAFTVEEWQSAWKAAGLPLARHAASRFFPFYQSLRLEGPRSPRSPVTERSSFDFTLRARASAFACLFPGMS